MTTVPSMDTIQFYSDLGTNAILLISLFTLWKKLEQDKSDSREDIEGKDQVIAEKDQYIVGTTNKLIEVIEHNTSVNMELKYAIEKNTEVSERNLDLTNRIFNILTHST